MTVAVAALAAGSLAIASPVAAGEPNGDFEPPWPILQVEKTIGQAEHDTEGEEIAVPSDTVFTVLVTCERASRNGDLAALDSFPETLLTFDSTGAPKSANQGGWQNLGDGVWTFQGPELKYKLCTAVETDVTPEPENLLVAYKCEATAAEVPPPEYKEEDAEAADKPVFGCVRPLPEGQYEPSPPAEDAAVQFTAFWDSSACEVNDVSAETKVYCQQTGTLTVDNFDPAWIVVAPAAPAAVVITPTFTG